MVGLRRSGGVSRSRPHLRPCWPCCTTSSEDGVRPAWNVNRYFLVPIHSTPLLLVVTFALGLRLAVAAGLAGIPLAFLLFSWFFKYCFVLFDSVVAGEDVPPVLSIEMVNPVDEQRPLVLAALLMAEGLLLWRVRPALLIAVAAVLPAHLAVLG